MLGCKGLIPLHLILVLIRKNIGFTQAINKEEQEQNVTLLTIGSQTLISNETLLTFQLLRFDC